jgi:fumarate hydratase subunit alpha
MKQIEFDTIVNEVKSLCMKANYELPEDVKKAFDEAIKNEESPLGKSILEQCVKNAEIAENEKLAICQDTGFSVFFVKYGDIEINGGNIYDAINEGVRQGYGEGYLRKSILKDPLLERVNTKDNTPAIVHLELVEDEILDITLAPKGGGSENMSRIAMMKPSDGVEGVVTFVVDSVAGAKGNPCPPTVVGVGIGGTFEKVAFLAKKALLRPIGEHNPDPRYAELEKRILTEINNSGVGPQGLGGRTTSFWVNIETFPCHIASMPVAVNLNCHASRHAHVSL